jgi:hypothetical protein
LENDTQAYELGFQRPSQTKFRFIFPPFSSSISMDLIPLLAPLNLPAFGEGILEEMLQVGSFKEVKSNTVLVGPGEVNDTLFIVVNGGFVCRYIDEKKEVYKTINFYLADIHPFMACIDSFFDGKPTHCELRAIANSMVLTFPKAALEVLKSKDEGLNQFFISTVIKALTEENDLKLKIIAYSSEDLYAYFIKNFPSLIQKVPSKYIAELMGISPEWLSKLKRK